VHAALASLLFLIAAGGQLVVYDRGDQKVALAGIVQPQVSAQEIGSDPATDRLLFRRLQAEVQVTASPSWSSDLQVDFGQSTVSLKNAYVQYGGWRSRGLTLTAGHAKLPFSRSNLTSGAKRETAERPFTGDRNFGVPNRILGARLDGASDGRRVQWSGAVGLEQQIVNTRRITFDSPTASATPATTTGRIVAGRLEWHPWGETPREQGDFHTSSWRSAFTLAGFRWQNDADRVTATGADLDHVGGGEASVALRGHGISIDAELHRTQSIAKDRALTQGIYRRGIAAMHTSSVEAGYVLPHTIVEAVAAYDSFEALAYSHQWRRFSSGVDVYVRGQSLKLQTTYRAGSHVEGGDARTRELFAEVQMLF
jgi:phosphate-selective porin O/P